MSINSMKYIKRKLRFLKNLQNIGIIQKRNLDTSVYTNDPNKVHGRGFGDIDKYDLF